ncbi:17.8 kDa class I heat shock protein-like [Punica granatum]|uniref:SHSP domain-containing protein n=2 Tax=Punica granatum TaxID=22663 RepID=A0A218WG84_PUNGR|nr:17.8 kDa class I heat shock protein-like [Punica granatum]OWM71478.1 hypothetical protein CDL15_Pgr005665 [Punica granatum]PKI79117.1 hypothetical protein CRG98_000409 [Punica granatum]
MSLISRIFGDETFDPFLSMVNKCPVLSTPTDWKETPEAHIFVVDLPGLKKDEVKVEIDEDSVLKISGERKTTDEPDQEKGKEGSTDKWHRVERCRGKFLRRFKLPPSAKTDQVKASMENGVLTVTIPKQEVKKPESRKIEIQEGKN